MTEARTELLFQPDDAALRWLPEGPWPAGPDRFSWVAIQHGADAVTGSLNLYDLATGTNVNHPLPGRPGFAMPTDRDGTFVVGCERSLGLYETGSGTWRVLTGDVDGDIEGTIINDGLVFADGVVFGTKDLAFDQPKAGLYLWRGSDRSLTRLRADQTCSNGKVMFPGGDGAWTLLDIDTPTRCVVAYRLDVRAAALGPPRVVVDLSGERAFPDGMEVTPDGRSLIIAMFDPTGACDGEVRQHAIRDGALERRWHLAGSPQVTCPRLVRRGGAVALVLTTATENMSAEQLARCPGAGALFVAETDWPEVPMTPRFRCAWADNA